jgi:hypothetical protein
VSTSTDPTRSIPNGLLAALVPAGVLVHPEVALTRSIWWLLGLEGAAPALDGLVRRSGIEPQAGGFWLTEERDTDGTRTDLEYRWGEPARTRVVVEAKLGHTLTAGQVAYYRSRLGEDGGLLTVLVPAGRLAEGKQVMSELESAPELAGLVDSGQVRLDVWSYDEVVSALERQLPDSADVAQFKALVRAHRALDIEPFSPGELVDEDRSRLDDIWRVVDSASFGLFESRLPYGADWSLWRRRYIPIPPYDVSLAVGVDRRLTGAGAGNERDGSEGPPLPWAWFRLPGGSGIAGAARIALQGLRPGEGFEAGGEWWLPLELPTDEPGASMIPAVRQQIEQAAMAIRAHLDQELLRAMDGAGPNLTKSLEAVIGMQPMDRADLLDTAEGRRADIELLVDSAARPFFEGRVYPAHEDQEYERNRWVPVSPLATYVSTSFGRKQGGHTVTPQPRAWLRIHETTPWAAAAYEALEEVAPGRVVRDPRSRAIPLDIPVGKGGPEMLTVVHAGIRELMTAIQRRVAKQVSDAPSE